MTSSRRRLFSWRIIPMAILTIVVIWVVLSQLTDAAALKDALVNADVTLVLASFGVWGLAVGFAVMRLKFMLKALGYEVPAGRILGSMLATWPLGLVTPSRMNDLLRAVVLRDLVPAVDCSGAVITERVIDIQSLCLLAAIGSAAAGLWEWFAIATVMWLGVWGGALLIISRPNLIPTLPVIRRVEDKMRRLLAPFGALRDHPPLFAGVFAMSMLVWLSGIVIVYLLVHAFGETVGFGSTAALWPMAIFVGLLPLTVAGAGTRDAAFVGLLTLTGNELVEAKVLTATLAYVVIMALWPALLGLPLMIRHMATFRSLENEDG